MPYRQTISRLLAPHHPSSPQHRLSCARYVLPLLTRPPPTQSFTTTSHLFTLSHNENFYTTLESTPAATPAQLKKQFYTLSKKYHPDLHPNDPEASSRFVRISTAWATLSQPGKRAAYDRDLLRVDPAAFGHFSSSSAGARGGPMPAGSHSSAQAYGARPASGLSRRRGTFRGPPPSFYRSGGWGDQGEKRSAAAEDAKEGARRAADQSARGQSGQSFTGTAGGFSPGQGQGHADFEVPHFDRDKHFQRQESIEEILRRRRTMWAERKATEREEEQSGFLIRITLVSSSIIIVICSAWAWETISSKKTASRTIQ